MKQWLRRISALTLAGYFSFIFSAVAQDAVPRPVLPQNWFALDWKTDGYYGISLNEAYHLLKGRKSKTVVVGVIDSGIDTTQKDLKDILWTNPKEKAANGVDDDHNGFVDDVHGWNFIGGPNAKCDCRETVEEVREYERLKGKYLNATGPLGDEKEYLYWMHVKHMRDSTLNKSQLELRELTQVVSALIETSNVVKRHLHLTADQTFAAADLGKLSSANDTLRDVKFLWTQAFSNVGPNTSNARVLKDYSDYMAMLNSVVNPDLDLRKRTVGDNPDLRDDKPYGNNILKLKDMFHGTMVAGFIGAIRNNHYGIDGVADNVRLIAIVASPEGDEYDKDVANSIYYAVNNGARVINMSFGKKLSPHKAWVDGAFKYAAAHDVLLVTAAGNDNQDEDIEQDYPNDTFLDGSSTDADNVINVGASGPKMDENMIAFFSNYGKKNVDVLAPGFQVTSVTEDGDTQTEDGTSFSAPIVSGIAALLFEYFPDLSARQVKQIILQSAHPLTGVTVNKPGTKEKVDITTLCKTGGVVNAYEAVQIALKTKGERNR